MPPCAYERFLCAVLRIGGIARQADAEAVNAGAVPAIEHLERFDVAVDRRGNQRGIGSLVVLHSSNDPTVALPNIISGTLDEGPVPLV